jgi:hypothetical protein
MVRRATIHPNVSFYLDRNCRLSCSRIILQSVQQHTFRAYLAQRLQSHRRYCGHSQRLKVLQAAQG